MFSTRHGTQDLAIGILFQHKHGMIPCTLYSGDDYSLEALSYLRDNGELISDFLSATPTKNKMPARERYDSDDCFLTDWDVAGNDYIARFSYKDCIIEIVTKKSKSLKDESLKLSITIFHCPGTKAPIEDFEQFIYTPDFKSVIYTIIKTSKGFAFEPFEVSLPDSYNINTHYEPEFAEISKQIVSSLSKNKSGLYLLHGPPGTGKTTYIKYLSSVISRNVIYVPTNFIDAITDPAFIPALLNKKHCVIVIEDAEKALLQRDAGDSSSLVSTILNLTDGIMGDIFNVSIIATYNNPRHELDAALLRKGRLKKEYAFEKLSVPTAKKLIEEIGGDYVVKEPLSLADIFNLNVENTSTPLIKEEKRMGFR
jgi:hypothetical protein